MQYIFLCKLTMCQVILYTLYHLKGEEALYMISNIKVHVMSYNQLLINNSDFTVNYQMFVMRSFPFYCVKPHTALTL